jgi:hypothetical protein
MDVVASNRGIRFSKLCPINLQLKWINCHLFAEIFVWLCKTIDMVIHRVNAAGLVIVPITQLPPYMGTGDGGHPRSVELIQCVSHRYVLNSLK